MYATRTHVGGNEFKKVGLLPVQSFNYYYTIIIQLNPIVICYVVLFNSECFLCFYFSAYNGFVKTFYDCEEREDIRTGVLSLFLLFFICRMS